MEWGRGSDVELDSKLLITYFSKGINIISMKSQLMRVQQLKSSVFHRDKPFPNPHEPLSGFSLIHIFNRRTNLSIKPF